MFKEQLRYNAIAFVVISVTGYALLWLRPPWWGMAIVLGVELVVGIALLYTIGPRYFPQMLERDPFVRAMRAGVSRRTLLAFAARVAGWLAAVMTLAIGPAVVLSIVAASALASREPGPSAGVVIGIGGAIWFGDLALVFALRAPLRRWAAAHRPTFPA